MLCFNHRREILFDYEQYEYHGTSVSEQNWTQHLLEQRTLFEKIQRIIFPILGSHDVFRACLGVD